MNAHQQVTRKLHTHTHNPPHTKQLSTKSVITNRFQNGALLYCWLSKAKTMVVRRRCRSRRRRIGRRSRSWRRRRRRRNGQSLELSTLLRLFYLAVCGHTRPHTLSQETMWHCDPQHQRYFAKIQRQVVESQKQDTIIRQRVQLTNCSNSLHCDNLSLCIFK